MEKRTNGVSIPSETQWQNEEPPPLQCHHLYFQELTAVLRLRWNRTDNMDALSPFIYIAKNVTSQYRCHTCWWNALLETGDRHKNPIRTLQKLTHLCYTAARSRYRYEAGKDKERRTMSNGNRKATGASKKCHWHTTWRKNHMMKVWSAKCQTYTLRVSP